MAKSGVALFLDLHGDEALPYVFTAGCEGVPGFGDGEAGALWAYRQQRFRDRLEALNPAISSASAIRSAAGARQPHHGHRRRGAPLSLSGSL